MWDKIKELGFTICAVALGCSNLTLFLIIAIKGVAKIWEPTPWILITEMILNAGYIAWGIERLIKDLRNMEG